MYKYARVLIFHIISFGRRTYINPVALFELSIHSSHGRGGCLLSAAASPGAFAFIMAACSEALLISHFEASSRDGWRKEDHFDSLRLFLHICRQLSFLNGACTSLSRRVDGCVCAAYECVFLCLPAGRRGLMAGVLTCPGDSPCSISGTSSRRALIFS